MQKKFNSRRDFIKKSAGASAVIMAGGILPGFSAASYNRIMGANDKLRASVMGVNSRGNALAQNFAFQENCEVIHVCDVDSRAIEKCSANVQKVQNTKPQGFTDFRKSLESKDVDILVVAAPDHWHAPAALLAMFTWKNRAATVRQKVKCWSKQPPGTKNRYKWVTSAAPILMLFRVLPN
jgi:hypothetical protein